MSDAKYKIHLNHLEERHGIARLEKDGHSRETITKSMYKLTEGMPQHERTKLMEKLYDRSDK